MIGSGVIAIELAQAMQRLEVKTTVFARSRKVGSLSSPALQKLAQDEISKKLNIKFETLPTTVQLNTQGVTINFNENNQAQQLDVEYFLVATGRRSYLDTLLLNNIDHSYTDLRKSCQR